VRASTKAGQMAAKRVMKMARSMAHCEAGVRAATKAQRMVGSRAAKRAYWMAHC